MIGEEPRRRSDPAQRAGRLAVGVLGTGRVGSVLAAALRCAGHRVVAGYAVSQRSRMLARRHLPDVPLLDPAAVVAAADLVLLTVADGTLPALISGLTDAGVWRPGQLVAHTSGAYGIGVMGAAVRAGVLPLAIHPAMTFTGKPEDADRIAGIPYAVTAPEPLCPVAEALVLEMGGEPVWVDEELRPLYHAAMSMASNHLVTLLAEAADLLRTAGVEHPGWMLGPLVTASVDGALRCGDAALTGPVVRGDADTVARHLAELSKRAPDSVAGYVAMARTTATRALAAGRLPAQDAGALLDVLAARAHA